MDTPYFYIIQAGSLPIRPRFSAKWDYGHAVIIGGSKGKAGSVCLAAQAAFHIGAGWTSVYVPRNLCTIYQTACIEIMCIPGKGEDYLESIDMETDRYIFGIGPGLDTLPQTQEALSSFFDKLIKPVVIDADAINILARNKNLLKKIPSLSILTPHKFEFRRLENKWNNSLELFNLAKKFASDYHLILIIKGAYSLITDGREVVFNATGNPALSKAGTGDVLTGMITGLLAQGISPYEAAIKAVNWHGAAADKWIEKYREQLFTPVDLIKLLKYIIK